MGGDTQEYSNQDYAVQDANTRLRDLEERNSLIKERVLLLGKNLLETKEELEEEVREIKKQSTAIVREFEIMNGALKTLLEDSAKSVKRDEMLLVERMLKDFQPLEFMRKKDVEELIEEKLGKRKT
jgi:hypothetical protein